MAYVPNSNTRATVDIPSTVEMVAISNPPAYIVWGDPREWGCSSCCSPDGALWERVSRSQGDAVAPGLGWGATVFINKYLVSTWRHVETGEVVEVASTWGEFRNPNQAVCHYCGYGDYQEGFYCLNCGAC